MCNRTATLASRLMIYSKPCWNGHLYKVDTSIKWTLFFSPKGVDFRQVLLYLFLPCNAGAANYSVKYLGVNSFWNWPALIYLDDFNTVAFITLNCIDLVYYVIMWKTGFKKVLYFLNTGDNYVCSKWPSKQLSLYCLVLSIKWAQYVK